ncbi:MAG: M6 family metalloprotease domain-containing protein [Bacteroidales bacterium]|nr:M6 family metalloprotease domain-containing protein [Bacteroidales bacterium]
MKKTLLIIAAMLAVFSVQAHYVKMMPVKQLQPNGDTLRCFISGDEFYHWLHDSLGYTIVKDPTTGYYVYACEMAGARPAAYPNQMLQASEAVAGSVDPAALRHLGIRPWIMPNGNQLEQLHKVWDVPEAMRPQRAAAKSGNDGTLNNIVVFVRFNDDSEITTSFDSINAMFNDTSANAVSMCSYFREASYGRINILTHYYPAPVSGAIVSYRDSHNRSYFMPRDSANTNGYANDNERRSREFDLIEAAVNYVNQNYPIPRSLNIDHDNDGYVDNICFIFKGTYTGWSDLLWPHKWSLYDRTVRINGKRVYTFNVQLEGSGSHYFSTSTFCHEMFHTLGAPDLYHYNYFSRASAVGSWDLMEQNQQPPQHMGAWMKMRYGGWIDSIPEISTPGRYTLHSVADQSAAARRNNCYAIATTNPSQYYILEYRNNLNRYETALPGTGLLVYRINTVYNGNASFNDTNILDEVYLFKPDAFNDTMPGVYRRAHFTQLAGRAQFDATTNPHPFLAVPLAQNVVDTTFSLSDITVSGDSVSFTYGRHMPSQPCHDSNMCDIYVTSVDSYGDTWQGCYLSIEGSNGYVYGAVSNSNQCSGACIQYDTVQICSTDTLLLRWNEGLYSSEAGFTVTSSNTYNTLIYDHTYGSDLTSRTLASVINPCSDNIQVDTNFGNCSVTVLVDNPSRGSVSGGGRYYVGDQAVLTAVPAQGYAFDHWSDGTAQSTSNPWTVTVTGNATYTAYFVPARHTVTLTANPAALGRVYGGGSYNEGDNATIRATANDGCRFTRWNDGSTVNPRIITVLSDTAFTANFERITYTVTLRANEPAMGRTTGSGTYSAGATVNIQAIANDGYHFNHWSDNSTVNPRAITLVCDTVITAFFERNRYFITALSANPAMGSVSGSGDYAYGDTALLQATSHRGYAFVSWSNGTRQFTQNPLRVVVTADSTFTAQFEQHEDPEGISSADGTAAFTARTLGRQLIVHNPAGRGWFLYDSQGRLLRRSDGILAEEHFLLPAAGLYVLHTLDGHAAKVLVP